jgi:hypothetical protein
MIDPIWQLEVDCASAAEWSQMLNLFDDANIYQTAAYGGVRWGEKNLSRLVLKRNGEVMGIAQLRIVRPTPLKFGIAYLRWGPLWERRGIPLDPEVPMRLARAIVDEYRKTRKYFRMSFQVSPENLAKPTAHTGLLSWILLPRLKSCGAALTKNGETNLRDLKKMILTSSPGTGAKSTRPSTRFTPRCLSAKHLKQP